MTRSIPTPPEGWMTHGMSDIPGAPAAKALPAAGAAGGAGGGIIGILGNPAVGVALTVGSSLLSGLFASQSAEQDRAMQQYQAELQAQQNRINTTTQSADVARSNVNQAFNTAQQSEAQGTQNLLGSLDRFFQ